MRSLERGLGDESLRSALSSAAPADSSPSCESASEEAMSAFDSAPFPFRGLLLILVGRESSSKRSIEVRSCFSVWDSLSPAGGEAKRASSRSIGNAEWSYFRKFRRRRILNR